MRETKMRYVNHRGDVFEFGENAGAYLCDFEELLCYEHPIKPKDVNLTVAFDGTVPESRGRFFQIVEVDSLAGKDGELWFGDYFIKGRVIGGDTTLHYGAGEMTKVVKFSMQKPIWTRSVTKLYKRTQTKALIINEGFFESPVMIEAFGAADGFSVSIGENNYDVAQSIPDGSRLVVDGLAKTVELVGSDGSVRNALSKREGKQVKDSGHYVFQKIPPGVSELTWRHSQRIRITIFEQASEPRWA